MSRVSSRSAILGFALLAALFAFLATRQIYRFAPVTSDENSYLFQAHAFAEGRLRRPYPELSGALHHYMIIMDQAHGWLSRYPPGHGLWLTPGVWLGEPRIMVWLAAGLATLLLGLAAIQIGVPPWMAALPLLISPYFINLYGTLLSHTSGLVFVCALLAAYLAWRRTACRRFALLAGLAWGLLFLNRTYTAALIALPFGIDAIGVGARQWRDRRVSVGVLLFAAGAGLGVLAFYGYNWLAIGDARMPTFLYYDPSEGLGFGPRHTGGLSVHHTPANGLRYLWRNVQSLDAWLWGLRGALIGVLALALAGWRRHLTLLLLGATLCVWLGYIGFWFWGIREVGGPVYFFETLPFLMLLTGLGLERLDSRLRQWRPKAAVIVPLLLALTALGALRWLAREAPHRREPQDRRRVLLDTIASAPPNAMIFLENITYPRLREVVFNPRGMDSDPLLVAGRGTGNIWLWRHAADRRPFLLDGEYPDRLKPLPFDRRPRRIDWEAAGMHRHLGGSETDETGRRWRVAAAESREGFLAFGRYLPLSPGTYRAAFDLRTRAQPATVRLDVAADDGRLILASTDLALPPDTDETYELAFTTPRTLWGEPRVYYLEGGPVAIGRIGFEDDGFEEDHE